VIQWTIPDWASESCKNMKRAENTNSIIGLQNMGVGRCHITTSRRNCRDAQCLGRSEAVARLGGLPGAGDWQGRPAPRELCHSLGFTSRGPSQARHVTRVLPLLHRVCQIFKFSFLSISLNQARHFSNDGACTRRGFLVPKCFARESSSGPL